MTIVDEVITMAPIIDALDVIDNDSLEALILSEKNITGIIPIQVKSVDVTT